MADWKLWERCGLELEYMIVDRKSLAVRPLADFVLRDAQGELCSELERGELGWSNELVRHVLEFKCLEPVTSLNGLAGKFHGEVLAANDLLRAENAMLLPTAAHPFMDPASETHLWEWDNREIYAAYNRIFNCQGHGWSNLQSTHLNLSFQGDAEFGALHAAIRVLLPLIPALAASSPYLDGRYTGFKDARLETYRHNQERIPSITGLVIPEAVFSRADYERVIFDQVKADIAPHDPEKVLNHFFLNSRGAIARFDRGAIEIRLVDIQECPLADVAIAQMQIAVLKALVHGRWADPQDLRKLETEDLSRLLLALVRDAEDSVIEWPEFLRVLGFPGKRCSARELWSHLLEALSPDLDTDSRQVLSTILQRGTLSGALVRALGEQPQREDFVRVYNTLADCLAGNRLFQGAM